jgi:hypothetical protein
VARTAVDGLQLLQMGDLLPGQITVASLALQIRVRGGAQRGRVEGRGDPWLPPARAATRFVANGAFLGAREGLGLLSAEIQGEKSANKTQRSQSRDSI